MNENNVSEKQLSETVISAKESSESNEPKGLGGWLIVVGLGLFASLGILTYMLWPFSQILSAEVWAVLTAYQPEVYNDKMKYMLWGVVAATGLLLAAYLYLVYLFIKKHYLFPIAYITIQIMAFFAMVPCIYVTSLLDPTEPIQIFDAGFVRSALYTLIWVAYMLKSVRVKNTFVEGRKTA